MTGINKEAAGRRFIRYGSLSIYANSLPGRGQRIPFKKNIINGDFLASEIVAFSNGKGIRIFLGVNDDGSITGLGSLDIHRFNQLVSKAASLNVKPAINPTTQNLEVQGKLVMIIEVPQGSNKPYKDKIGVFWVKSVADKRKSTSWEEIFQSLGLVHADETLASGISLADLDMVYFRSFFQKRYRETLDKQLLPLERTINNLNLGSGAAFNLNGELLSSKNPSNRLQRMAIPPNLWQSMGIPISLSRPRKKSARKILKTNLRPKKSILTSLTI